MNPLASKPMIHPDRRGLEDVAGATPASGRGAVKAPQRGPIQIAKDMKTEASSIRGLYGSKEKNASETVPFGALTRWFSLTEELARHLDNTTVKEVRTDMVSVLKRLERTADRLEKAEDAKNSEQGKTTWATMAGGPPSTDRAKDRASATQTPPVRRPTREVEVVAWIKGEEEIERVHKMSAAEVVALARGPDALETLAARRDIQGIRRFRGMIVFRVSSEGSKKVLESNDFWIKEVSNTAILRRERAGVVVHGVRVKSLPKDMKREGAKAMEGSCKAMHQGIKIEEVAWLTRESEKKEHASIVMWVDCAEAANTLIQLGVVHESDIKIVEYYDMGCRMKQCMKCQEYGHLTYGCKNPQRCAHCAQSHRSGQCPHPENVSQWKCGACKGAHKAFDPKCPRRQKEKIRIKEATKTKPLYHAVKATGAGRSFGSIPVALGNAVTFTQAPERTLKRKAPTVGRPSQASIMQSIPVKPGESIAQQLTKKKRSDESMSSQSTLVRRDSDGVATPSPSDISLAQEEENLTQMDTNADEEL